MSIEFECPSGHRWLADPSPDGWLPACPRCGAAGLPQPSTLHPAGETLHTSTVASAAKSGSGKNPLIPGYEILHELGRGGMGVVYLARHVKLGRLVALKMLLGTHLEEPRVLNRFRAEAEAIAALQHPNIVAIYELGEIEDNPWFAMEYVPGGSLAQALAHQPMPPRVAAQLVATLARAIDHAHQRGIIHRDLKPANVLLTGGTATDWRGLGEGTAGVVPQQAKITDFGLARKVEGAGTTRAGDVVGTPSYMAPEQASGVQRQPTPSIDIYALGAILYECLTGRPPFVGSNALDVVLQVLSEEPLSPRRLTSSVPADLETIALKCLQKETRRRYATAAELAQDLDRYLAGEPILARPISTWERSWKWAKRRPVAAAFLAFALLAVAGFTATILIYNASLRQQRDLARRHHHEAEQARSGEQQQRQRAEERLLGQYLAQSTRLMENGDLFSALPVQIEALALEAGDTREKLHRLRVAATLARTPRLIQLWKHDGAVHDLAFSSDGRLVASASEDGQARLLDLVTGATLRSIKHSAPVRVLALGPDAKRVASGDSSGEIRVLDVASGKLLGQPFKHQGEVTALRFSPDGSRLLSAGREGLAFLHDMAGLQSPVRLEGHAPHAILFAGFSPDGQRVVTTAEDGAVRIWRGDTGQPLGEPLKHALPVHHAVFTPDARQLFTATGLYRAVGGTGQVVAWDLATGKPRPFARRRGVRKLVLSGDGTRLIAAHHSGQVAIWEVSSGEPILSGEHNGPVLDVGISTDDRRVLSASGDGTAQVWELSESLTPFSPALRHGGAVTRACFRGDGRQIATASADGLVRVFDLAPLAPSWAIHHPLVHRAGYSPDGKVIFTLGYDGVAQLWDAATANPRTERLRQSKRVNEGAISPDGKYLATAGSDGSVALWDVEAGDLVWRKSAHTRPVRDVAFAPRGDRLISGGDDGAVYLWEVANGKTRGEPLRFGGVIRRLVFVPDGQEILVLCGEKIHRCSARTTLSSSPRDAQTVLTAPGGTLESMRLGGKWLAAAFGDGVARIWDPGEDSGKAATTLRYRNGLSLALFDPPGKRLVTLAMDRTASVWEIPSGKLLAGPLPHPDPHRDNVHQLFSAGFSPEGHLLVTGDSLGKARVWDLSRGELLFPPLALPWPAVTATCFSPEGHRLLISAWSPSGGGGAILCELAEEKLPLKDLRLLGELLSGQRLSGEGRFVETDSNQLAEIWKTLRERHPRRFTVRAEEEAAWLRWEAETSWAQGQWRGLEAVLDALARIDPQDWRGEYLRGQLLWRRGRPSSAAAAFARGRQLGSGEERLWLFEAACRLQDNDLPGYRLVCADALSRFGKTRVPEVASEVARICLYGSDMGVELDKVVELARRADLAPEGREVLAGALLRKGDLKEARRLLEERGPDGGVLAGVLLALVQVKSGQQDLARKTLEQTLKAWSSVPFEDRPGMEMLRRETEFLLQQAVRAGSN